VASDELELLHSDSDDDDEEDDEESEAEEEEEALLEDFLADFLEVFFPFFLGEGFFGSLYSSLELPWPSPFLPEPHVAAVLLPSFNQALALAKLSKISIIFQPFWQRRSRSVADKAPLQALLLPHT
jgi:hypothetical protein